MHKWTVLGVSILLLLTIECRKENGTKGQRPHIVYILADDTGWDDISYHGSDQIPTPNIDCLGYHGVILNRMYTMPICTPSRAAFLTGKYPIHTGMQGQPIGAPQPWGLPPKEKLLPQYLKEKGYITRMIGKWHLGYFEPDYIPIRRGFDSFFGYYNGFMGYYSHITYDVYNGRDLRSNTTMRPDLEGQYATDLFTDEAVDIITNHPKNKPLFLYLAHLTNHAANIGSSLEAPQENILKFGNIVDPNRKIYAAMVSKLDESVGKVMAALDKSRMLDDCIVVFMCDNGAPSYIPSGDLSNYVNWGSNYPFRGTKDTLWEGGVRSPTIIWSRQLQENPRVSHQLMHMTDWLPTFLSAADTDSSELPEDLDGIDQWDAILNNKESPRNTVLLNIDEKQGCGAIIKDYWKLTVGKCYNGTHDGFYGDFSLYPGPPYRKDKVLGSVVCRILSNLGRRHNLEECDEKRILALRNAATQRCPNAERNSESPCGDGPCLFNLKKDPCETKNVADCHPEIASELLQLLNDYNATLVPQRNQPADPNANPIYFNNCWQPWEH